jgi:hypothetical protein
MYEASCGLTGPRLGARTGRRRRKQLSRESKDDQRLAAGMLSPIMFGLAVLTLRFMNTLPSCFQNRLT